MPAIDKCQGAVLRALSKEGWVSQKLPHPIRTQTRLLWADMSLKQQDDTIIIAEVKCFSDPEHDIPELYTSLGQYLVYRQALLDRQNPHPLYLAMPQEAYERLIQDSTLAKLIEILRIKFILVDLLVEEVREWIT